ncbi:MAG: T9SS type A sorting domain-containing protein, partial [Bacteroidia bacterium]
TLWTRKTGTADWDFLYSVTATWDGGFLCAGGTYGAGNGDEDIFLVRFNSNGDTLWTKTIGGIHQDEARSIVETQDSLFAMVANTQSMGDTLGDGWLLRLDQSGDTIWTRISGYPNTPDFLYDVCDFPTLSRILICGEYTNADAEVLMRSMTYTGNPVFTVTLPYVGTERYNGIAFNPYNGYFGTLGFTSNQGWGNGDIWFLSDLPGSVATTFGQGSGNSWGTDELFDITGTRDGGFAACGYMTPQGPLLPDVYLVKIDSTGFSTQALGIFDAQMQPSDVQAFAYPNPAAEQTIIQINSANVFTDQPELLICDAAGRNVNSSVAMQWSETGSRTVKVVLGLEQIDAGVYFYSVVKDGVPCASGRLVVTK